MVQEYVQEGGEKYRKFARSQLLKLTKLREHLSLPAMQKHFLPESGVLVSVWSSDFNDRIRITAGSPHFYYASTVPPCLCRGLNVTVTFPGNGYILPTSNPIGTGSDPFSTLTSVIMSDGQVIATASGTMTTFNDGLSGEIEFTGTGRYGFNGIGGGLVPLYDLSGGSYTVVGNVSYTPPTDMCLGNISQALPGLATGQDDGTLAPGPNPDGAEQLDVVFSASVQDPEGVFTDYTGTKSLVQEYNPDNGDLTGYVVATYDDVILGHSGDAVRYNGTANFVDAAGTEVAFNGTTTRIGSAVAEAITAVQNDRTRRKTCSDNMLAQLEDGVIPAFILDKLLLNHPSPQKAKPKIDPVSFTIVQTKVQTFDGTAESVDGTSGGGGISVQTYEINRTVTFEYMGFDVDGNEVLKSVEITGTATTTSYSRGSTSTAYTVTLDNFPAASVNTLTILNLLDNLSTPGVAWASSGRAEISTLLGIDITMSHPLDRTGFKPPYCSPFGMYLRVGNGTTTYTNDTANSNVLTLSNEGTFRALIAGDTIHGLDARQDTISWDFAANLEEFYQLSKPEPHDEPQVFPLLMSTVPEDGEIVTIIPIIAMHDVLGDLGMFATPTDRDGVSRLKINKGYNFVYSYADKTLTHTGNITLSPGYINKPAKYLVGFQTLNVLFSMDKTQYTDIQAQIDAQKPLLAATDTSAYTPTQKIMWEVDKMLH